MGGTQRAQYPLIREYTLNHNIKAPICFRVYSLIKGYWALWEEVSSCMSTAALWERRQSKHQTLQPKPYTKP